MLTVLSPIFMADTKLTFVYNFVPLLNAKFILRISGFTT